MSICWTTSWRLLLRGYEVQIVVVDLENWGKSKFWCVLAFSTNQHVKAIPIAARDSFRPNPKVASDRKYAKVARNNSINILFKPLIHQPEFGDCATYIEHVVHTPSTPSRMEFFSSPFAPSGRASRSSSSPRLQASSRPSSGQICAEEEGMATTSTKSIWREAEGWFCRDPKGRYAP